MMLHPAIVLLHALTLTTTPTISEAAPPDGSSPAAVGSSYFEDLNASASGELQRPVGLFPLWENSAAVLRNGDVYLGSSFVGLGIGGRFQLGTHPLRSLMSAPNAHAKLLLIDGSRLRLAAHAELLWLQERASDSFWFTNITSRLNTRRGDYWIAPVGLTASWAPVRGLFVTLSGVAQGVTSESLPEPQATLGASAQLEWRPLQHHALTLHAAEVGFHRHDFAQVGGSYRYQRGIFDASVGCAIQMHRDGLIWVPVAAAGVQL